MSETNIRAYENRDVVALARLITELGTPTSPEEMSQRMAQIKQRKDFATFVAEEAGSVIGMVGVTVMIGYVRDKPNGQIMALVVSPRARGRGIGALLTARAEAWLADNGAGRVIVTSGLHRTEAHAFYQRLGYRDTGRRFIKLLNDSGIRSGRTP